MKTITMKVTLQAAFTGAALGMIPVVQVSHAQQVVDQAAAAAKQATITQSLNGTAVQNIAAPNAAGLSHNQFSTFNVSPQGLVINNSSVNAISQIGGAVVANPHLGGGEARLILNEVTSGNRSILQGTQELLGGRVAYILANPNGISCDGCGFINFPRATLTTGVPLFYGENLTGFGVTGGDVSVGAGGLNATGVDFFDIITRSAQINGQLNANDLSLRLGSNDMDYATLTATARTPVGTAPSFALDSSALGGMYAGRISLIGTEAGVGVRMLGDVAASVSDVEIDMNGQISMKGNAVAAQRHLTIRSAQLASAAGTEIELDNVTLSAVEQLRLEGGDVVVNGGTALAGADLSVNAASMTLSAGARLMGEADGVGPAGNTTVDVAGALNINDAALFSGATLDVTAGSLNIDAASNVGGTKGLRGAGAVNVAANSLNNAGLIGSDAALTVTTTGTLTNSGTVYGKTALGLMAGTLTNSQQVESGAALNVAATTVNNTGKFYGQTGVTLTANTLNNSKLVESGASMTLTVADINNVSTATTKAELYAVNNLSVVGNHTLDNTSTAQHTAAIVARDGQLSIDSRSGAAGSQAVTNAGGLLFGGNGLSVLVSRLFDNKLFAGKRAYTFANNGNILLGAPNAAAVTGAVQDITIVNTDADIEARAGNVNIFTSFLRNTTNNVPVVGPSGWTTSGDWFYDHDDDPSTDSISIESDCGTNADHFDRNTVGKICARWVETRSQYLVNPDTSPRGRIIAGNDFSAWIEKEALNYISLISAGRNVTISGDGTFENRAVELRRDENALVFRYEKGSGVACGSDNDGSFYELPTCYRKVFVNISPGVLSSYTVGMGSTVQAGGSINVNVTRLVNQSGERGENASAVIVPGTGPASGTPTGGTTGPGAGIGTLTGSPFFVPSRNPTSPYLFETDPRLMSLTGLYGSDLFLNSLGVDPAKYLRVGDPYFEQQLLRQQLLAEAGQLFVAEGMANENEQFKVLMDNAVAAAEDLQLRVGVALTKEQIANLKKDIVWMVEVEVDGKKALVPQLYLSDVTKANLAEGAKFVATNIDVKTEGAFVNSGAFVASNNLNVDAGTTFTNTGGALVAANGLNIQAVGDILNQSGTIRGGDVSVVSTEGSIVNETLTATQRFGDQGNVTQVGPTATIESTGSLNLNAKNDIVSRGGELNAGTDATLTAGRDITLTTVEKETFSATHEVIKSGGHTTRTTTRENVTGQVGSGLNVGGNLNATAGNDIHIVGSAVDVAGGGRLDAGNDINIAAAAENRRSESSTSTKSWNSSYSQDTTIDHTTGKASTVNFGGDLAIASGNNVNVVGSQIAVGGDLNVERIGGDLNVTTFEEKLDVKQVTKTSAILGGTAKADAGKNIAASEVSGTGTLFSRSTETTTVDATTNLRSGIAVGGNLNAGPGAIAGDVNITGSNIATGGDMNLQAGGDINILAANDSATVTTERSSSSLGITAKASVGGGSVSLNYQNDKSQNEITQTTAQVSGVIAGGNINLDAGGNFREQGTQVAAGGDINVAGKTITSEAAQDTYKESGSSRSVSVGLGITAETGLDGVVSSFINPANNKAGFDMAQASQSINALSMPDPGQVKAELTVTVTNKSNTGSGNQAVASGFVSGGNVSFTARDGDATFHGTNVDAAGNINVSADKGAINILTADSSNTATQNHSETSVSVGVSGDGTISGSGSNERSTETNSATSQQAASFKAGGDMNLSARDDVTLRGTELTAGGTASVESREGAIKFEAAQDTTSSSSNEKSAHASVSVNVVEKSGSVGGGGGEMSTSENTTTGKAGSINAGNIVLKSKDDITLVGTNLTAKDSATIQSTDGKVDFQAVTDTHTRTANGWSMDVNIEAGKSGGGVEASGSRTDEFESSTDRRGGSINAANLTISAGNGVRLEGTQVDVKENASIDTGTGALTLEAAVSTSEKRINNTSVGVALSVDKDEKSGQGSVKAEGERTRENKVSNSNAQLNIGGTADIKAAGGIDIKGKDIAGVESVIVAGTTNLNGAAVNITQLTDVDESSSTKFGVSVGVIVPSKKTREMVADKARSVRDSDTVASVSNKLTNAGTSISNTADSARNALRNLGADDTTRKQNNDDLSTRQQTRKDAATDNKLERNNTQADRAATKADAGIKSDLGKKDQKADFDRQQSDDKATRERDQKIAAIDPTLTQAAKDKARADIDKAFNDTKVTNEKTADDAKRQNASDAADARDKALDDIAQRKKAAEDKAADAKIHREEAAGNTDKVDALKAGKTEREAQIKADNHKAKADNTAQKTRTDSDFQAQRDADDSVRKARESQRAEDAKADADTTLSEADKTAKKEANARDAQKKIDDAQTALEDKKRANAETAETAQLDARKAQDEARIAAEQEKRKELAKGDADAIAKAADDAKHQRELADAAADERKALAKADGDAEKANVDIDRNNTLTAEQKAEQRKDAADKQAADREKALQERADVAAAKEQVRDDAAKKAERDAIDPKLSDADKQAEHKKIDDKYADRKTERDAAVTQAKDDAADQRRTSEATAQRDLNQRKAQAQADAKREADNATADKTHDDAVVARDDKLKADSQNQSADEIARLTAVAEKDKRELAAIRDAATAENKRIADDARVQADADRAKADADAAHQRESDRLAALTPPPADLAAQRKAADDQRNAAKTAADDRAAAQKDDNAASAADARAQLARDQRNADIDADTTLSAKDKAQKKKDSESTFLADQKATQQAHDTARKAMEALMTPAEKAAADKLAKAAEEEGARVKNPYAMGTKVKQHYKKAMKWKEALTAFGAHHTSQLPMEEEEEEPAPPFDTLVRLAGQFPIADQGNMLALLGDADVQQTAAITAAVDAMRSEARDAMRQELQEQYTGKALGVLTVAQQREALSDLGLELPAGLPSAEVTRRFNAYLDTAVASQQPDSAQMKDIVEGLGIEMKKDATIDDYVKKYGALLDAGSKKARAQASGMGMTTAQVNALVGQLQP